MGLTGTYACQGDAWQQARKIAMETHDQACAERAADATREACQVDNAYAEDLTPEDLSFLSQMLDGVTYKDLRAAHPPEELTDEFLDSIAIEPPQEWLDEPSWDDAEYALPPTWSDIAELFPDMEIVPR